MSGTIVFMVRNYWGYEFNEEAQNDFSAGYKIDVLCIKVLFDVNIFYHIYICFVYLIRL